MDYFDFISKEKKILKIDNNFRLIHKNILMLFIDINKFNQTTYEKINDYILISYPKGKNDNSMYVTYIGKINEEAIFTSEFILIYNSDEERIKHIQLLNKYLDNYLKGISLIKDRSTPIINDKYEIIGILIKNNYIEKYNEKKTINNNLNNKIKELEDDLKKEKNSIINLNNEMKILTNDNSLKETLLKEEKSKNNNLKNENDKLSKELQNIKLNNNDLQNKIIEQNNDLEKGKINCNILINKNNEIEKEIKNIKLDNSVFLDKFKKLNDKLEKEKSNNKDLKNEIIELKEKLNSRETELNKNKSKMNELNQKLELYKDVIENSEDDTKNKLIKSYEELKSKENEIKEIQSRYPVILSKEEKLICVILISTDQNIHYPIICKSSDNFTRIEELLYQKYPKLSESENFFLANGKKINRFKDLEYNEIKYGDVITLSKIEI